MRCQNIHVKNHRSQSQSGTSYLQLRVCCPTISAARMMCRGCSTTEPATTKIQVLTDQVKEPQLEEKAIRKYSLLKAVEFNSQLVTGTNYFVKVQVDDDNFLHLRVFENPVWEKALGLAWLSDGQDQEWPADIFLVPDFEPGLLSTWFSVPCALVSRVINECHLYTVHLGVDRMPLTFLCLCCWCLQCWFSSQSMLLTKLLSKRASGISKHRYF